MFDAMVRCFVFFHEVMHLINKRTFPSISNHSISAQNYLHHLYHLYDEYFADRSAYLIAETIFSIPTEQWKQFTNNVVLDYLKTANDPEYYNQIVGEIERFPEHSSVDTFLNRVSPTIEVVSITTAHAFSRYHHDLENLKHLEIPSTKFVNQKTLALMEYFNDKFKQKNKDLNDGVNIMTQYMTNFGIKFEDRPPGLYYHIFDI